MLIAIRGFVAFLAVAAMVTGIALACGPSEPTNLAPGSDISQDATASPSITIEPNGVDIASESPASTGPAEPTPTVHPTWTNEQIDAIFEGPNTPTYDEHRQASAELDRRQTLVKTDGPETAGSSLSVGGRLIQVPSDVYVKIAVAHAACAVGGFCPLTPYYVLARGKSTITVEGPSGKILEEDIYPGEGRAFDFLTEGPTVQIVSIAGIFVTLPSNASLVASGFGECAIGDTSCDSGQFLIMKRGNSTLSVSPSTGQIFHKDIAHGEEGAFDLLKKALGVIP